jgi:hypothetical protein
LASGTRTARPSRRPPNILQSEGYGIPTRPIPSDTLRKLDLLVQSAPDLKTELSRTTWTAKTTKQFGAFSKILAEVSQEFFEQELDLTLLPDDPTNDPATYK